MNLQFFKYEGTGNDFVIVDNRSNQYDNLSKEQVKFICDRHFGIGADGLMLLNKTPGFDFGMTYFNSDGGESSMCGNGGRCLVKFAYDMGIRIDKYVFLAVDGPHEAVLEDRGWVRLKMKDVPNITRHNGNFVLDTGSPHFVEPVTDLANFNVYEEGKDIRFSKEFRAQGINVNFVQDYDDHIMVRTYERGVENETLSCGTGVTAAALVFAHNEQGFNRIEVKTLGGHLAVEFYKEHNNYSDVWLIGPATYVFKGEIEIK